MGMLLVPVSLLSDALISHETVDCLTELYAKQQYSYV